VDRGQPAVAARGAPAPRAQAVSCASALGRARNGLSGRGAYMKFKNPATRFLWSSA
jgi:hypothetical protein